MIRKLAGFLYAKKTQAAALLVAVLVSVPGCALLDLLNLGKGVQHITVNPRDIVFEGLRADGLHFNVGLDIENRTDGRATLKQVRLEALVGGANVVSATRGEALEIAPRGCHTVRMPVVVNPLSAAFKALAPAGEKSLSFRGGVTVDLGILGDRVFSFETSRGVFPERLPKITFRSVSMKKSTLRKLSILVTLGFEYEGATPFKNIALAGTCFINGMRAGDVSLRKTAAAGDSFEFELKLSTLAAARIAAGIARGRTFVLKLDSVFTAERGILKFRIPYVFERKGVQIGEE